MGEVIAVLSGKGGTGKTSLCAGIAAALAQLGESVLCIDCDVGLRNLDILLGMSDSGTVSFMDICNGNYTLSQAAVHPAYPKLSFLTAPVNLHSQDVDKQAFSDLLCQARKNFDFVLLDAPTGLGAGFQLCADVADRSVLVTTPEPASIRDAARTGQVLELMGKSQVRIVVNRVCKKMLDATKKTVDDMMDEVGLPLLGVVPEDENVSLAAISEEPLLSYSRKGAAAACLRIAKRITGQSVPISLR